MASATTSAALRTRPPRNVAQREAVLERLGNRLDNRNGTAVSVAVALALHVGVLATAVVLAMFGEMWTWHSGLIAKLQVAILDEYQVDIVKDEEPPPPAPVEPEPPKEEEAKPEPTPPTEQNVEPQPQPQAAAQAGKVLAAEPAADEPLDMTNVFVQGTGDTYTGGTTSAAGTGTTAVRGPAAATGGSATGTGAGNVAAAPPAVDKSRRASLSGSSEWDCPFPPEADALQEDLAYVNIRVQIGTDGRPTKVTVTKDPGHGFAREARTCAMQKKFLPALDSSGAPVLSENEYRVRFER